MRKRQVFVLLLILLIVVVIITLEWFSHYHLPNI